MSNKRDRRDIIIDTLSLMNRNKIGVSMFDISNHKMQYKFLENLLTSLMKHNLVYFETTKDNKRKKYFITPLGKETLKKLKLEKKLFIDGVK